MAGQSKVSGRSLGSPRWISELSKMADEVRDRTIIVKINSQLHSWSALDIQSVFSEFGAVEEVKLLPERSRFHSQIRYQTTYDSEWACYYYQDGWLVHEKCCEIQVYRADEIVIWNAQRTDKVKVAHVINDTQVMSTNAECLPGEMLMTEEVMNQVEESILVSPQPKKQPNVAKEASDLAAHQVFEEMPKSNVDGELLLLDEIAVINEELVDGIDWEATPMGSIKRLYDEKVLEEGKTRDAIPIIFALKLPIGFIVQESMMNGVAAGICFDPGGNNLSHRDHSMCLLSKNFVSASEEGNKSVDEVFPLLKESCIIPCLATQISYAKHVIPELEIYCYLLVLMYLIDQKKYNEAKACSSASIVRPKSLNRRTLDVIASGLYFYYSLSYELAGELSDIRGELLTLHRLATLHHDELGQETLLNLLLRNYRHYNLYDQAEKLRSKAPRFEAHSNQQFSRYLFYLGKIRTIQLEYTDAKESLLQAARKAPVAARGFRIYSFVAKGTVVLAEHTSYSGKFSTIAVQCLQKLPRNSSKYTYSCDGHTFNFLLDNGFVFLLVADEASGRSLPFVFLERVKDDFQKTYASSIKSDDPHPPSDEYDSDDDLFEDRFSIAYNFDREFGTKLKERMQYCMSHPEEMSKLPKVKSQISELITEDFGSAMWFITILVPSNKRASVYVFDPGGKHVQSHICRNRLQWRCCSLAYNLEDKVLLNKGELIQENGVLDPVYYCFVIKPGLFRFSISWFTCKLILYVLSSAH